jgi:PBP1b-binding outer membrane lipoprotein LpoB
VNGWGWRFYFRIKLARDKKNRQQSGFANNGSLVHRDLSLILSTAYKIFYFFKKRKIKQHLKDSIKSKPKELE